MNDDSPSSKDVENYIASVTAHGPEKSHFERLNEQRMERSLRTVYSEDMEPISPPGPKGDKDVESENKVSTVLNGYDAEVIDQFREMKIDDKDILGVLALRAMSEGDKKEVDRLFDAGADMSRKMPGVLLGGEGVAQAVGSPRFVHMMTQSEIYPDMITHVGDRLSDINIETDKGATALDMLEKKSAPSMEVEAWKAIGAQNGSGVEKANPEAQAAASVKLDNEDPAIVSNRDAFLATTGPQVTPLRAMGLRDDEVITMFFLQAVADGDKKQVDTLRAAGGSIANDVPEKVFGPTMTEEMGHPKIAHVMAEQPEDFSPDMIKHASYGVDEAALRNSKGQTPLMIAAEAGSKDHVDAWIKSGADIKAKDNEGNQAFIYAAAAGHPELSADLVKATRRAEAVARAVRRAEPQTSETPRKVRSPNRRDDDAR